MNQIPSSFSKRACIRALAAIGLATLVMNARSQPRLKMTTITTGFAAGGSSDVTARILADYLRGKYSDVVIVENKVGASGRLAVEHVKNAPADGSGLLISPSGMMVLFPHIYKALRYDPLRDFAPITPLAKFPFVLAISTEVPASVRSLPEFIAWCKANPARASFGSPGSGTSAHFSGIMLGRRAGMEFTHVPYKGMAPLVQDLMGGQIASGVLTPADALPLLASGKLRLLATTGAARSRFFPEVPTYTELGFGDIQIEESYSLYGPASLNPEIVARIANLVHQLLALPETQSRFAHMGLEVAPMQPSQFQAYIKSLYARWAGIVKSSGFTPSD